VTRPAVVLEPVADRLAAAEAAFALGDLEHASAVLAACAAAPAASPAERAQAASDLAVIAAAQGDVVQAEALLLGALHADPGYPPALENLAVLCQQEGDLVQATHWWQRRTEAAPEEPAATAQLIQVLHEQRRVPGTTQGAAIAVPPSPAAPRSVSRVLIVVQDFHPAVGGTELLAEAVGLALRAHDITVEVATCPRAERALRDHRGMTVHEVGTDIVASLQAIVRAGSYDGLIAISNATVWPVLATLSLPRPRPWLAVVPCVNTDDAAALHAHPDRLAAYARLLAGADAVGYSSLSAYDVRLCEELGTSGYYLPNAVERIAPDGAAPTAALPGSGPLLVMVANLWPGKNHAGLLEALAGHPGDWRLALIGHVPPQFSAYAERVRALAAADPRVHLLGPATPAQISAAMDAADALLLPSLSEATPLVLLEAMSHRLPWIATPSCGAAHDHAGGLIVPTRLFGEAIDFLLAHRDQAADLGAAGFEHWRACYTWDVVGERYVRMLRGLPLADLSAPSGALESTEAVRARFYDGRPRAL
jgi:glycosyltransferase involved in cell wall biosynthesis